MSRKHSSSFSIGGLRECTVERRSASRSPGRTTRNRKKKDEEGERAEQPMMMIDEEPLDVQAIYERDLREENVYQVAHEGTTYYILKDFDPLTGNVIKDRRKLCYVVIERGDLALSMYICSCDDSLKETYRAMGDRAAMHMGELIERQCRHAQALRTIVEDHLRMQDIILIDEGITPISDSPRLFITLPEEETPGVVRVTAKRLTCIVCRKDTCMHVKEMNLSPHMDENQCEEEEGTGESPIEWVDNIYKFCSHEEPLHCKEKEVSWVDAKGIQSPRTVTFLFSSCCRYVTSEKIVFVLSEITVIDIDLLRTYESLLAKTATTLSGYWKALIDQEKVYGSKSDRIISLPSLTRAWNRYLARLEIPYEKFGCDICGAYPNALVFDGIQMGLRANITQEKGLEHGICTFREYPLPYIGKLPERNAMLKFLKKGDTPPEIQWPEPINQLLKEAVDGNTVRAEYKSLLKLIFCNSPIPLLLQAGVQTEARMTLERLLDGSLDWNEEEICLLKVLPTLYSSIKPLLNKNTLPTVVIRALRYIVNQSDSLLTHPPHIERYYGPCIDTHLECFPLWPLQRGLTRYTKDKPTDKQMECSEKEIGEHRKLSPGLLLVTCTHRRPYGFRIMKSPESVRDIFQVLLTRLGSKPPPIIIYENACMLAVYTLAREPARFANVRFMVDRFHHANHMACSQALRIRSYQSDPILSSYNTQACEQTNSMLRHLGNSLPFMSLERYTKTLILFLSRN